MNNGWTFSGQTSYVWCKHPDLGVKFMQFLEKSKVSSRRTYMLYCLISYSLENNLFSIWPQGM